MNFLFSKRYIFRRQDRTAVMDASPYFWLLNSIGKMMICSRHNQKGFEVPHAVKKYPKIRIPSKRYGIYTVNAL